MTSLTLWQPKSSDHAMPMSEESVKDILARLHARYGSKWADMWRGVPMEALVAEWSQELAGFTRGEIRRGMDAIRTRTFPPTLPEFIAFCRPPIEAETSFLEAVDGIRARGKGRPFNWSHPAIYWAAAEFGTSDLAATPWEKARTKWTRLLGIQMERGQWRPIPAPPELLPPPDHKPPPPNIRAQIARILKTMPVSKPRQDKAQPENSQ